MIVSCASSKILRHSRHEVPYNNFESCGFWSARNFSSDGLSNFLSLSDNLVFICRIAGSLLESMANAVEQAAVVLLCFTEKYKDSPSCRTG